MRGLPLFNRREDKFRFQAKMMAILVDVAVRDTQPTRESAKAVCEWCELKYIDHPQTPKKNFLLCNGKVVTLAEESAPPSQSPPMAG